MPAFTLTHDSTLRSAYSPPQWPADESPLDATHIPTNGATVTAAQWLPFYAAIQSTIWQSDTSTHQQTNFATNRQSKYAADTRTFRATHK